MKTPHKNCKCSCCQGTMWWYETPDYDANFNFTIFRSWYCDTCGEYVAQGDEKFEFPDE